MNGNDAIYIKRNRMFCNNNFFLFLCRKKNPFSLFLSRSLSHTHTLSIANKNQLNTPLSMQNLYNEFCSEFFFSFFFIDQIEHLWSVGAKPRRVFLHFFFSIPIIWTIAKATLRKMIYCTILEFREWYTYTYVMYVHICMRLIRKKKSR